MTFRYVLTFLLLLPNAVLGAAGLTYHGRLIAPSGVPVTSSVVRFRIQVRTPGSEDCLMYEEEQIRDLSQTQGVFELTIGANVAYRRDSTGLSFDRIFSNYGTFNLPGLCGLGGSYTPGYADNRRLEVAFNDGTFAGWEPMPTQAVNYVPTALSTLQVGGFTANSLLRVEDGSGPQNISSMSFAQFTELMSLILGTSTQYMKISATGASLPSFASDPSGVSAGQMWYDSAGNVVKFYNGSTVQTLGVSGSGISSLTAGAGLTGGTITTSGTIALATTGTAGTYYQVTTDAYGRVTAGQSSLLEADLPTLMTAGKVSGSAITSGTIGGSTAISTSGAIQTTGDVTSRRNILYDHSGVGPGFVGLQSPADMSGVNYTLTFPLSAGTAGQVLSTTNTSGTLAWTNPVATDLSTITGTGIVQRNGANSYSTVSVVAPLSYTGGNLGLNAGSGGILLDGGNTVTGTLSAGTISNHNVEIKTANTTRMTINTSGNVGIGTTSPTATLHVYSAAGAATMIEGATAASSKLTVGTKTTWLRNDATNSYLTNMDNFLGSGTSANGLMTVGGQTGVSLNYGNAGASGTSGLYLNSSGNVGIGTTSPGDPLTVRSSAANAAIRLISDAADTTDPQLSLVKTRSNGSALANDYVGSFNTKFLNSTPLLKDGSRIITQATNVTAAAEATQMMIQTMTGGSLTTKMFIDPSGKVGIGTNSPDALLNVNGRISAGADFKSAGNSPIAYQGAYLQWNRGSSTGATYLINNKGTGSGGVVFGKSDSSDNFTEQMRINDSGNVGIGTSTPSTALEVNGVVKATSFEGTMVSSGATNSGAYTINTDSNSSGGDGGFNFQIRGSTVAQISDAGGFFVNKAPIASESFAVTNAAGKGSSIGSQSNDGSTALFVTPNATTQSGLTVRGLASQSAALFKVQDSTPADKFIVAANGNVGVGTSNPVSNLDVASSSTAGLSLRTPGNVAGLQSVINLSTKDDGNLLGGANNLGWQLNARGNAFNGTNDNQFNFAYWNGTSWNNSMTLTPGGNIGIGTTDPKANLSVSSLVPNDGTVQTQRLFQLTRPVSVGIANATSFGVDVGSSNAGITNRGLVNFQVSSNPVLSNDFGYTPNNTVMSLTGEGKVGIGTTNPSEALEVSGNVKASSFIGSFTNSNGISGSGEIHLTNTNTAATTGYHVTNNFGVTYNPASTVAAGTYIYALGNSLTSAGAADLSNAVLTSSVSQANHVTNSNLHNLVGGYSSAQNSGTGTITTAIGQEGYTVNSSSGKITSALGGSFAVYNETSGEVLNASGINAEVKNLTGTIQNAYAGGFSVANTSGTINTAYGVYVGPVQATNKWSIYASDPTVPSYFAGNVGIGTTSPSYKLHVVGASANLVTEGSGNPSVQASSTDAAGIPNISVINGTRSWSQRVEGSSGGGAYTIRDNTAVAERLRIDSNGNFGIGTTSPGRLLDVAGWGRFASASGDGRLDVNSPVGNQSVLTFGSGASQRWFVGKTSTAESGSNAGSDFKIANFDDSGTMIGTPLTILRSNGNVGIGTTAPGAKLHIDSGNIAVTNNTTGTENSGAGLWLSNGSGGDVITSWLIPGRRWYSGIDTSDSGKFKVATTNGAPDFMADSKLTIDTAGNVGIGTTNPGAILDVYGPVNGQAMISGPGTGVSDLYLKNTTNGRIWAMSRRPSSENDSFSLLFHNGVSWSQPWTVTTAGDVGIGTATPGYKLDVQGGDINASGSVRAAGVALTSDIRYKRDIETLPEALGKILRIRGVSYNWRTQEFPQKHFSDRHQIGVIAQEVEAQFPEVVDTGKDGYKSVNYAALVAPLIEGVKTLYRRVVGVEEAQLRQEREMASIKMDGLAKDQKIHSLEIENAEKTKEIESIKKENAAIKQWICAKDPKAVVCN